MTLASTRDPTPQESVAWPPARPWVRACVTAEAIGITAAASAAVFARVLHTSSPVTLAMVVAGGLVEGAALGIFQAGALGPTAGESRRRSWAVVTVIFAGLAWAVASIPAVQEGGSADGPVLPALLLGAAGLGGLMGAVLGAVQAPLLRGLVPHPFRWVAVSALSWTPAMVVIFAGASLPAAEWPPAAVLVLGPPTGALAGLLLGALTIHSARAFGPGYTLPIQE